MIIKDTNNSHVCDEFRCDCLEHNLETDLDQPEAKYPSPSSVLSQKELNEIKQCIKEANRLLLSLGNECKYNRFLQSNLRHLRGVDVLVKVHCHNKEQLLKGLIIDAGFDFLCIRSTLGSIVFIPYDRISSLRINHQTEMKRVKELSNIHPLIRESLILNFGKVVSNSPYLLNVFFGIELRLLLESYVGCNASVRAQNDDSYKRGVIERVTDKKIVLNKNGEKQGIDFDELCTLKIEGAAYSL